MDKLAAVLLFTSQGVPFIHGGQEFLRSKFGEHNSYNQPDSINMIRWELKQKNYDIFEYYKVLIELRKNHPMFKMTDVNQIKKNINIFSKVPQNCIAFTINNSETGDDWSEVLILLNPNRAEIKFEVPNKKWNVVVSDQKAGEEIIETIESSKITVKPISGMVLYH